MTTLSKDEILRLAREADCWHVNLSGDRAMAIERLTRFATLCRADLVVDWNKQVSIALSLEKERDALRAEIAHLQQDCQTEAATVVALRAENERLVNDLGAYQNSFNALRAELSALRAGSGEAVALVDYSQPNDVCWGTDEDFPRWLITASQMMVAGALTRIFLTVRRSTSTHNPARCLW